MPFKSSNYCSFLINELNLDILFTEFFIIFLLSVLEIVGFYISECFLNILFISFIKSNNLYYSCFEKLIGVLN